MRIVKDNRTGLGKGIAYVIFKDSSGVLFALKQNSKLELDGRKLRISRCRAEGKRKKEKMASEFGGAKASPQIKDKRKTGHNKIKRKERVKQKKIT